LAARDPMGRLPGARAPIRAPPAPPRTAPRRPGRPSTTRGPAPSRCGPVRGLHWHPCLRALPSRLSWRSSTPSSRRRPRAPLEHAGQWSPLPPGFFPSSVGPSSWDQQSLASTFSTMALNQPQQTNEWYFDSGATSHISFQFSFTFFPMRYPTPCSIVVGNVPCFLSHPPVILISLLSITLIMFWFHLNLLRTLFPFDSLPSLTIAQWNLTRLVVL